MTFQDLVRDTLVTLQAHKLRTALTMFGIAWGIVSITLMVGAGEGLRVGQARVMENFGKDVLIVFAGRTSMQAGGTRAGRRVRWRATDHQVVLEQAPDCEYAMPELGREAPVRFVACATRLYEQKPGEAFASARFGMYVRRWVRWAGAVHHRVSGTWP